jgi:uncharacterized protein YgbK (DUF1537 family)
MAEAPAPVAASAAAPPERLLRYAYYGDDFTGATDTLATLAQAGLRSMLFLGVPDTRTLAAAGPLDALGIAGVARSLPPAEMRAELAPVADFFSTLPATATLLHYKCCSTFDSAPGVGNLHTAVAALRHLVPGQRLLPIVGGQPSLGRYCAFGQLFAAAGEGGEVLRIDRHPTMSRHPVTPMHEADLRLHLAAQGWSGLGLVDWRALEGADDALALQVDSAVQAGDGGVLFDALTPRHLQRIGGLLARRARTGRLLALGASSVAQAACAQWHQEGVFQPRAAAALPAAQAPVLLLVGSLSPVTAAQVDASASHYHHVTIDPGPLLADAKACEHWARACADHLNAGRHVLAITARGDGGQHPAREVAQLCGHLLARVLAMAPAVRRVGIAGGDSSSHAVRALGVWGMRHLGQLAPGVPLVRTHAEDPRLDGLELMLKGGQMGPRDVLGRLVD